jgi:hypothetical protein
MLGDEIFSKFRDFFDEKQKIDELPKDQRNDAMRNQIKVIINAITGRFGMVPENKKKLKCTTQQLKKMQD